MKNSWISVVVFLVCALVPLRFQSTAQGMEEIDRQLAWVNTTYDAMSLDQKIGQLFMIRAYSKGEADHERQIESLIRNHHIGGLCFFQGNPKTQVELTNRYQQMSRLPMMISIDAEWGLGMRFKDRAISFPRQLTMGAIRNNRVIYEFGAEVARELKAMGIHLNFAPVVDVNNNPANPVINNRSFGESRKNVTAKGYAYMRGLQDHGILACAKHFPGHGDTEVDSHKDLPVINHDLSRLDSLELYPFRVLSQFGIASMMIAHLQVPALEKRTNTPTTLSYATVTEKLKDDLKFEGLIITDALDMKGVTKHHQAGALEVEALAAGNDILLLSEDVAKAKTKIKEAIQVGRIPMERIDESVKKILTHKYQLNLTIFKPLPVEDIYERIITAKALGIKGRLYEEALTCVKDDAGILPFDQGFDGEMASLSVGTSAKTIFQRRLGAYASMTSFTCGAQLNKNRAQSLFRALSKKDVVIISLDDYKKHPRNKHGLGENVFWLIEMLNKQTKVILVTFGSPYVIKHFEEIPTIVQAYEDDELAQDFCAQALFGVFDMKGMMPVKACEAFPLGMGKIVQGNGRLGYVIPEVVGMDSDTLDKMDALVEDMIQKRAAPGCQILVARKGKIVHHKSYGYHDYNRGRKVQLNDLYDVASITKVAATTIVLMRLADEGKLDLRDTIGKFFPEWDTTNKVGLVIEDILAHHAKLPGWIPFFESTLTERKRLSGKWYRRTKTDSFNIRVTEDLYLREDYLDSIFCRIATCDLREKEGYRYSDLGFYMFDQIVQKTSGMSLDEYCKTTFYDPLGLRHITFNPIEKGVARQMIPPTEEDNYFRTQKVHGYVHDMGAAMRGGVAGHAGLFSNAHDLATIFQMLMNDGEYAGRDYIEKETIERFTTRYNKSTRRGLGFDMKELNSEKMENMCNLASKKAFGHLGFTGTCVWADPEEELIFVFLSNRTYPSMRNNKLHKENYRPKLQCLSYKALIKEPS